jgi:hypothetical protein
MANYRVTAPMVNLKVKDQRGRAQVNGFYAGAIIGGDVIDPDHLARHLDRGWIEPVDEPADEPAPEPAEPPEPAAPAPVVDPDAVPVGTADEVLAWVGDDRARAGRALVVEKTAEKPRITLIDKLTKLNEQQA